LQYINGLGNLVTFPTLTGFVTAVTGTSPIASSGGTTPAISIAQATTSVSGFLSSTDWNTFNGKQNALTNPVTGTGTTNTLPKFTGASAIGNSNITDSGTLITLGSNTTISSGGLGIGATPFLGVNLLLFKNITGATTSWAVLQQGAVQSDVTTTANGFFNQLNTQAASFTTNYNHFVASQNTIGAGSVITTQTGYNVSANLTVGTNNYGFRGQIPSGTNRWNLYMDGTATNYLAGDTGIGTASLGTATQLTIGGTETAVSAIARGQLINSTLVASANGDRLIGLDIAPTYTIGAFTSVEQIAIRLSGRIAATGNLDIYRNTNQGVLFSDTSETTLQNTTSTARLAFRIGSTDYGRFFPTTGNFTLQNGGTFTDAGFRLDVNGTTRFIGTASSDTAPLGSELAAVTGTGTNWTLAGTNLNVGGYTHATGSVVPLTTALAAVNGTYYQIAYTITGRTAGSITIDYGGTSTSGITATGATGPLASSTAVLTITPTTDFNGTVVLSIKSISTSIPSSTFSTSAGTSNIEVRASSSANNTFIGLQTGRRNTTGTSNTFIGIIAGRDNTTGSDNTFIGAGSGQINTIAGSNTFVGANTGANNVGTNNSFFGTNSGLNNTTGGSNTFLGVIAGRANTTGGNNTFVGRSAGQANTTGSNNDAFGIFALTVNTTGLQNTAFGNFSLTANTTGSYNSASGQGALQFNTTGSFNVGLGYVALNNQTTGSSNIAIGTESGRFITGGSTSNTISNNSIFIGASTKAAADNQTNQIVIGTSTTGLGSNTTIIGTTATTITGLYGNIRLVSGMGTAPASSTSTGTTGDIVVTAGFIYVCSATNTWVRTALTTF
jgi:hypothetical protein